METVGYILYNKLNDEELSMEELGWKNAATIVNKVFLIANVANGKTENVFSLKKELGIDADENIEWYEKEYVTESVQEAITERLFGTYKKEADFYEKLLEAYVLSVVKDSDGEDNLKEVLIPSKVRYIGNNAFEQCIRLSSVTFSTSSELDSIANEAFRNTNLKSIMIPEKVRTIGDLAFYSCDSLASISLSPKLEYIGG